MRTQAPDLLPLFRSDLQARLLATLLLGPEREVAAAELQERLGASRSGVNQELRRLRAAGILEQRTEGRSGMYRVAAESPLVPPLRLLLERTLGVEVELRRRLAGLAGIEAASIFGSWAQGDIRPSSDIDLLVIGTPDADDIERAARAVERQSGREINLSVYTPADWNERVRSGSGFAHTVLARPMIELIGSIPR
jgi:predicted nucleotidyltransferase/biotin operon repressor